MIIGIGTDLLEIERIGRILAGKSAKRFIQRLLTKEEQSQAEQRQGRLAEFIAGRFSAKEAVAKALGCGIGNAVSFLDIEITYEATGKPICRLSSQSLERLRLSAKIKIHLSVTHTESLAAAYAVVEEVI
jgi:holo-[acyl-carrier protein] synthase